MALLQKKPEHPILIVDDERGLLLSLKSTLKQAGYSNVVTCHDSREVSSLFESRRFELLLLDLFMPHVKGEDILATLTMEYPDLPIIIVTGAVDVATAVRCMKNGAFDYITKPIEEGTLLATVRRAIQFRELVQENQALKEHILSSKLDYPQHFVEIVTNNDAMLNLFKVIESVAASSQPVLLTGETGTGKELFARAIHKISKRRGKFVVVNVAGLDDNVFSDTLFGHIKGAFTGADHARRGLIEKAAGGTLVLDEIGDLSQASQVKLLRLLQNNEYFAIGMDEPFHSDTRIIAASNRDLWQLQEKGTFRKDLNFRLRTHYVNLPPLRERMDDLPLLTAHFMRRAAQTLKKKIPTSPKELLTLLSTYQFPGNVRELESMIFDAVSQHQSGVLSLKTFKRHMDQALNKELPVPDWDDQPDRVGFPARLPTIKQVTQLLVEEAMQRTDGNRAIAARMLGISPQALGKRLKKIKAQ